MYPPPTQFETRELRLAPERLRVVVGEDAGTVRLLEESGFSELPRVGLLVLSTHLEERYARELLEGGAAGAGYLLNDRVAEVERFIAAVRRVARGGTVLDPKVVAAMVRGRRGAFEALTGRERDVLTELAAGRSNRGIAGDLFVSERAVERHVTAIFGKLDLPGGDRTHRRVLAVLAHRRAAA